MLLRQKRIARLAATIVLCVMLLAMTGCGGKTVAVVNGEKITHAQLENYMKFLLLFMPDLEPMLADTSGRKMLEDNILESIVEHILVKQAATRHGVTIATDEIEEVYQKTRLQLVKTYGEEGLNQKIKQLNISEKDFRGFMIASVYSDKLLVAFADTVTEEEVREYLAENPNAAVMIEASQILLATEEEAQDVREQLMAGADFGNLAEELSLDPAAKLNRGYLNMIPANSQNFDPAFMVAANALQFDTLSEPVESEYGYGWYLIKLHSRQTLDFAEIYDSIKGELTKVKFNEYMSNSAAQADIKYK